MPVVYKLTREDGLEYIGITIGFRRRLKIHSKSKRFAIGIKEYQILLETDSYQEAEKAEEYFIEFYDTFRNGLNLTYDGKGKNKNTKFNTFGHIYSETSKQKMSLNHRLKRGYSPSMLGKKHTDETKRMWSEKRKGEFNGKRKISHEDARFIIESYINDTVFFDKDYICKFIKESQIKDVESLQFDCLIAPNGKPLNKKKLYGEYFAKIYNVTSTCIGQILDKKRATLAYE